MSRSWEATAAAHGESASRTLGHKAAAELFSPQAEEAAGQTADSQAMLA